jgi:hypothetical protein
VPATQLEIFKIEDQKEAVQIHECLQKCQAYINSTVHNNNVTFYKDANSVWQVLTALKARLSPSDRARELELSNTYAQMKRIGENEVFVRGSPKIGITITGRLRYRSIATTISILVCRLIAVPHKRDSSPLYIYMRASLLG